MKLGFSHTQISEFKSFPVFIFLFCLGFFTYHQAVFYPFVHDDIAFIQQNPQIASLTNWTGIFERPAQALTIVNPYWRPVLEAVYRLEYRLFGFNPVGYHFFNVLLHILNSSLIFYCLKAAVSKTMALSVAIVFLLHPVQTEAVACVSGISNLVYAFFGLLSFWAYQRRRYLISLVFFTLALLAKEQAIVFPFLILLYEYCFSKEQSRKTNNRSSFFIGFFLVSIFYFVLRKIVFGSAFVSLWQYPHELALRLLAIPRTVLMYGQILLWPQGLHYYRSIDILAPWAAGAAVLLVTVITAIFVVRYFFKDRLRPILFGLGWFFITLLPTLNIVPIIHEYSYIAAFEHFLYLPLVGFFLFIFLGVQQLIARIFKERERLVLSVSFGILVVVYGGLTSLQTNYWQGEVRLFKRAARYEPNLGRVHFLLGRAYYFDKKYDAAISEFLTSLSIMRGYLDKVQDPAAKPFYFGFIKDILFDMAHCFEAQGEWAKALYQYQEILSIPQGASANIYNSTGKAYAQMGNLPAAKEHFAKAVELEPKNPTALNNLAVCYLQEGDYAQAEALLKKALQEDSQFLPAQKNLGRLLSQMQSVEIHGH